MVSESFLEHGAYLASGDLRLEVEQASRRRHQSDNGNGPKPSRSMSLFASWRPKHLHGETKTALMRFSELARKEEDDVSLSSMQSTEESQNRSGVTAADSDSSSGGKCEVKDSGVGLDEHPHSQESMAEEEEGERDVGNAICTDFTQAITEEEHSRDKDSCCHQQADSARSDQATVVCEDSNPDSQSSQSQERTAASSAELTPNSKSCNIAGAASARQNVASPSDGAMASQSESGVKLLDGVDAASPSVNKDSGSAVERPAKAPPHASLGEVGRTLSTPSPSSSHPQPHLSGAGEGHTPVQRQNSLPDSQKHPPPEPRKSLQEKQTDYLMRRSQSLKRGSNEMMQKTNEAISGFWKLASKAASASYSKFNELKQSITTPIKNAASISSLTRSQDDLDGAGGSDRGSVGGCEEDRTSNSSTSGTIKERLRHNGSQDMLSTSESSYAESSGQGLSQTSLGENSLGKLMTVIIIIILYTNDVNNQK